MIRRLLAAGREDSEMTAQGRIDELSPLPPGPAKVAASTVFDYHVESRVIRRVRSGAES